MAAAAATAWVVVAITGGGMDFGRAGLGGHGPLSAAVALAATAVLAAIALWRWTPSGRGRWALVAAAVATWAAASIAWAPDPALAWLAANRGAAWACAVAFGVAIAGARGAARGFAAVLGLAALVPVGWSVAAVALPQILGEDGGLARLSEPVGHPNVLALIAAFTAAGALTWPEWRAHRRASAAAAAAVTVAMTCSALTLSRGGMMMMALVVAMTAARSARPYAVVVQAVVAAVAAAPAVVFALTQPALSDDGASTASRQAAGALFGLLLVVGVAVAVVASHYLTRRIWDGGPRLRRALVVAAVAFAVAPIATMVLSGGLTECDRGAVDNSPDRVTSLSGNQRGAWWCEAARGWSDAVLTGNGAGSFPAVQRRVRTSGEPSLLTVDPHEMWLEAGSAGGVVGVALLAALWIAVIVAIVRRWSHLPAGLAAVPVAALAQAQADWVLSWPVVALPVGVAMGLVLAHGDTVAMPVRRAANGLTAAALTVGVGVLVAAAALPYLATREANAADDAVSRVDVIAAREHATRAMALNPLWAEPLYIRADAARLGGDTAGAARLYRRVVESQPDNWEAWQNLARFLQRVDPDAAAPAWTALRARDPYNRYLP